MDTNGLLIILLVVAVVSILLLKGRLDRLSVDMQEQAMLLFKAEEVNECLAHLNGCSEKNILSGATMHISTQGFAWASTFLTALCRA